MAKTLTIKEKILAFISAKGIKKVDFFEKTGIQSSNFKGRNLASAPGSDILVKILTTYPDLSPEWLLLDEGDMIKTNRNPNNDSHYQAVPISRKITEIYDNTQEQSIETRPRIPYEAAAGGLSIAIQSVSEDECEQVPVIPTLPRYDFTIIARGDSMEPQYLSGDELACLFIHEKLFLQWGRPHVLDTAQGIVVKRIFDNGDSILCRSNNPEYPDFSIPKSEIYHIAIVVGLIRHF